ncbi:c-type cytochrome, partial [Planctomycetota bacterium]
PDQRTGLGNWDFAIDFERKQIVKTGETGGGFGLVFDEAGNSFTTYNINYLQQRVIPHASLAKNPEIFPFNATENISDQGESARIFPIVQAETRVNHPEQAGHFSSAGGMGLLERGPLHAKLGRSVFVCDVVCNLVHRDLLRADGVAFRGTRAAEESDREFIASRDPACRPIGIEHGPDGAMYLVDMQRDVIEHPDYIPQRVLKNMDVRAGDDRGRIYRIAPKDGLPTKFERLDSASSNRLVELLSSGHRWQAETAHRLLADRSSDSTMISDEILRRLWAADAVEGTDAGRVRSLWLLKRFGTLPEEIVRRALEHASAMVRTTAIQISAERDHTARLRDLDASVRFHAVLSLDGVSSPNKLAELTRLYYPCRDKWMRRGILLAIDDQADQMLYQTVANILEQDVYSDIEREAIRELANTVAAGLSIEKHEQFGSWFARQLALNHVGVADLLHGLNEGWKRRPQRRLPAIQLQQIAEGSFNTDNPTSGVVELLDLMITCKIAPPARLEDWTFDAISQVTGEDTPQTERMRAMEFASRAARLGAKREQVSTALIAVVESPTTAKSQKAAIDGLRRIQDPALANSLCERWSFISPRIRVELIHLLLSRREYHSDLLTAIENGVVTVGELNLDLEQRRTLLRWSSNDIGRRAAKLFGDEEYSNRKNIVREWLAKLPELGDREHGMKVYREKCATCHRSRGEGHRVGPDLQAMSHRSIEDLLTHILDPNMSINPNYVSCVVQTIDGQIANGLLKQETPESVTLIQADAKEQTIPRSEIESFQTLATSLMPEGLEKDLKPSDLRSLITYLQDKP